MGGTALTLLLAGFLRFGCAFPGETLRRALYRCRKGCFLSAGRALRWRHILGCLLAARPAELARYLCHCRPHFSGNVYAHAFNCTPNPVWYVRTQKNSSKEFLTA